MTNQPKECLSLWQLFVLIVKFETGSAVVLGLGNEAQQDAWLAVLLATLLGVLLVQAYYFLLSRAPGKNLYEIMDLAGGKMFSKVLTVAYVMYFFYISSRVLRDLGELMTAAILPNTPLEVISLTLMMLITYIIYLGLENLARMTEIFIPYVLLFIFIITILFIVGGVFNIKNLLPPLAEGFPPIVDAIFPTLLGFPFGEMIAFTIIIAHTSKFKHAGKVSMAAVGIGGAIIAYATIFQLGTLGVDARLRSNFPLLSAVRNISVANFLERLDASVVFVMMLGIIVKVSIFFFVGLKGLEHVFRIPYRPFVFPMGMLIAIFSILISENFAEHVEEGIQFVPFYLHIPFQIGIPALILVLILCKQRRDTR